MGSNHTGIVSFVGAGPGDPELITSKGLRKLQQADVVIYDRLAHPGLLLQASPDAKLIYCGKQPCQHTLRQQDIHHELRVHARRSSRVVRLKGGDPGVFGRVGEEAEELQKHQIRFEIIPGVTSGSAAPAYAGVPLTHRDYSRSYTVVTGHGKQRDGMPDIQWGGLAAGSDTIVFYMGVKHAGWVAEQLIQHGRPPGEPVLIVQWGTYGRQQSTAASLASLKETVHKEQIANPAIIVVGAVTEMHTRTQWFDPERKTRRSIAAFTAGHPELQNFTDYLQNEQAAICHTNQPVDTGHLSPNTEHALSRLLDEKLIDTVFVPDYVSYQRLKPGIDRMISEQRTTISPVYIIFDKEAFPSNEADVFYIDPSLPPEKMTEQLNSLTSFPVKTPAGI
jgi:uroporphyrinogen III methyltransferase/synthase